MSKFDPLAYQKELASAFAANVAHRAISDIRIKAGAGARRLAASDVATVEPLPITTALPTSEPWAMGVASLRGKFVVVVHLEHLLTGEASSQPRYCLLLKNRSDYALAVNLAPQHTGDAPLIDLTAVLPASPVSSHKTKTPVLQAA